MTGPSEDRVAISPQTVAGAGLLVAVAGLILAGVAGAPYLSSEGVNGWIVVFAAGLFAALVGAGGSFSGDSLAGTAGLLAVVEGGLVVVTTLSMLLSG